MTAADGNNYQANDLYINQKLRNPSPKMTEATEGDKDLAKTIVEEDIEGKPKEIVQVSNFNAKKSFFALFIIMMIRVTANWQQKSIGYFYGFKGSGLQANNGAFEMATFYPEMESYFGLLVGLFYTMPYALSGLYMGNLTKSGNRKWMLLGVITLCSLMQIGSGTIPSFALLASFRFLHGAISSAVDPLVYGMVADMFPPEKRTTANSILSAGNFLGIALSSMTILLIKQIGWKMAYNVMGVAGLGCAGALLLVREPLRGMFDKKKLICADAENEEELSYVKPAAKKKPEGLGDFWKSLTKLLNNPVCNNIFKAQFLRGLGSAMISAYAPVFFIRTWPDFKTTYALLNAIALIFLGFSSSLLGGIICDKYEKKIPMIKAYTLMFGNFMAIPLIGLACWTSNFYIAMSAFAAMIFACGSYYAPAVTMMQNSVPPEDAGIIVSTLHLFTYTATTISPLIFSRVAKYYNAAAVPKVYGLTILLATVIGYGLSNIFYYKGGKQYCKIMEEKRLKEQYDECVIAAV